MHNVYDCIDVHADEAVRGLQTLGLQSSASAQNVGLAACAKLVTTMRDKGIVPSDYVRGVKYAATTMKKFGDQ